MCDIAWDGAIGAENKRCEVWRVWFPLERVKKVRPPRDKGKKKGQLA